MRIVAFAGLLLLGSPVMGQTLQREFDAAAALLDKGDARGAAAAFQGLLRRMPQAASDPQNRTAAVIRSSLGQARLLLGDTRSALLAFERAVPGLSSDTPEDRKALAIVLQDIGRIHELNIDYPKAREALRRSLALKAFPDDHPTSLVSQLALTRVSVFDDAALAARTIETLIPALEQAAKGGKGPKRDMLGEAYTLRGRIHLNHNEFREAREWYERALELAGGLSHKVSVEDTRIRSDLAIVHHLLGEDDKVRRYLAYTGAGRGDAQDLGVAADMPLPACGVLSGIRPEDMAIVEYAIASDGRAIGIQPIFASRPLVAAEFARAVARWSWEPEAAAKFDPFWRAAVRVELRCSNAESKPALHQSLRPRLSDWLRSKDAGFEVALADAAALPLLRRELDARVARFGEASPQVFALLMLLTENAALKEEDRLTFMQRAAAAAAAIAAPPEVRVRADVQLAKWRSGDDNFSESQRRVRSLLIALIAKLDAAGPESAVAAAYARTELASMLDAASRATADELYRQVTGLPTGVLPEGHPIRQTALLQLASSAAAQRRAAEAAQLAQATGLSADQCALADIRPVQTRGKFRSEDFPDEAIRWEFNGFVKVSYDISTDGKTINPRTVMAYPPFVFSAATEKAVQRLRFQPFAALGSQVGCVDRVQAVRYWMSN